MADLRAIGSLGALSTAAGLGYAAAKYVYSGIDRGDGTVGTLHASNISEAAGAGSDLRASLLRSGVTVDDVTGTLVPQAAPVVTRLVNSINGMPIASTMQSSWIIQYGNKLYYGYTSALYDYPTNVIVFNMDTLRSTYYDYGVEIRSITEDHTNNRLLAAGADGYVWHLETGVDDGGAPITWEVQSKDFMLQTRAHFPRYAKYDVDGSLAASCEASILIDGAVLQTHQITSNRDVKKRLVATGNGKKQAIRLSGTGVVSIYAVETE